MRTHRQYPNPTPARVNGRGERKKERKKMLAMICISLLGLLAPN
jgi:hypothetical protein